MPNEIPHFINGKPVTGSSRKLPVFNPALGKQIAEVGVANQKVVDEAVAAAPGHQSVGRSVQSAETSDPAQSELSISLA